MNATRSDIEQIALNAIRWRDKRGNVETITKADRRWLLQYIDRLEGGLRGILESTEAHDEYGPCGCHAVAAEALGGFDV